MDRIDERSELMLGKDTIESLKDRCVALFGLGGVGGYAFEALVRCGIGRIHVIDNDAFDRSNLNRQILAVNETIGMRKTSAAVLRAKSIRDDVRITYKNMFVLKDNVSEAFECDGIPDSGISRDSTARSSLSPGGTARSSLLPGGTARSSLSPGTASCSSISCGESMVRPDYIIDCIDTVTAKLALVKYARENEIPIISSMGTGNKLDASRLEVADIFDTSVCPLCKVMRRELRTMGINNLKVVYSREEPLNSGGRTPGSLPFVPGAAGLILAGEVVRDLCR